MYKHQMANYLDSTLLKAVNTPDEIRSLCEEAKQYGFASVCVNPMYVSLAASLLQDSQVEVCTVVGFPLGANTLEIKLAETRQALQQGAREIDMVLSIGRLKAGEWDYVQQEVAALAQECHQQDALLKVILENCYLTSEEIAHACQICEQAGADYVKTSTGFGTHGAIVEDVALMRQLVSPHIGVKAAGGIRDAATALAMVQAGATRLGTSQAKKIVDDLPEA